MAYGEEKVEKGSWFDLESFSINSQAEPIMRYWQLSEALSRMSKRISKRYPEQARILRRASEDICFEFYNIFSEAQEKDVQNQKNQHQKDVDSQLEKRKADMEKVDSTASSVLHQAEVHSSD